MKKLSINAFLHWHSCEKHFESMNGISERRFVDSEYLNEYILAGFIVDHEGVLFLNTPKYKKLLGGVA